MLTRKQYMDGECTHDDYYLEIAREAGISYAKSDMLPRVKACLARGDEHLNDIPLREWDARGRAIVRHVQAPMKARGDYVTPAGLVCVVKAAARHAAENDK
ncbi:MAG: hypothetical protein AB7L09_01950 [Nitrospira sp.]